jgi:hypothetical protein
MLRILHEENVSGKFGSFDVYGLSNGIAGINNLFLRYWRREGETHNYSVSKQTTFHHEISTCSLRIKLVWRVRT